MAPDYVFHPMSAGDLPMVRRWLETPEVVRWWGDADEQYALVSGDLDHPDMDQFIVAHRRASVRLHPVLRAQHLESEFRRAAASHARHRPVHRRPDMIGRGHGSGFIRQFVDALLASGIPRVVTDPDPDNGRAVRAYTKAGFQSERVVDTPDGPALLMVRNP